MRRFLANLFICGFLAAQVLLMTICYTREAKFFGWQMFSYGTGYRLQVFVIDREGAKQPLELAADRNAVGEFFYKYVRPSDAPRVFSRGTRFLVSEAERLPAFLCRAVPGYRRVEVTIPHTPSPSCASPSASARGSV